MQSSNVARQPRRNAKREVFGIVSLTVTIGVALLMVVYVPFLMVFGAAGDWFERRTIMIGLLLVASCAATVVGIIDTPFASIIRSKLVWLGAAAFIAVAVWAQFGIDSTHEVRALPEARLVYPRATNITDGFAPADGFGDGSARAIMFHNAATTDDFSQVKAFYVSELASMGWVGPHVNRQFGGLDLLEWRRDELMFQLQIPSPDADRGTRIRVKLYGPDH